MAERSDRTGGLHEELPLFALEVVGELPRMAGQVLETEGTRRAWLSTSCAPIPALPPTSEN